MALTSIARYGGTRITRRLARSIPWLGAAVALLAIGSAMRRKGMVRGTVDTALNAVPWLGGIKLTAETLRGRDFIGERPRSRPNDADIPPQRR